MLFRNPEVLYFLILLLVPVFVHLFQLQKYQKIAFTNVAFLKKISMQTRKSSRLKKWLILLTRILLFLGIIFGFSQPYFPSDNKDSGSQKIWVYLDNSISLNSLGKKGELLRTFTTDISENIKEDYEINFLTNDDFYKNIGARKLKSILKNVSYSNQNTSLESILLKMDTHSSNTSDNIYLISDFQNINESDFTDVNRYFKLVSDVPEVQNNVSIDSLLVTGSTNSEIDLKVFITNHSTDKISLPFSFYVNNTLSTKQSVTVDKKEVKSFEINLEKKPLMLGEIRMNYQDTFLFDNSFYFVLDFRSKIKVLSIGEKSNYLSKIYVSDKFEFNSISQNEVNYNLLKDQQFVILNEVESVSKVLRNNLIDYLSDGGNLFVIPAVNADVNSYNMLFKEFNLGSIKNLVRDSVQITRIEFSHPIFSDVFSKKVQNFEYPSVYSRYPSDFKGNPILGLSNKNAFIEELNTKNGKIFWCSSPINEKNSNFIRSPLIVPTLYNLAFQNNNLAKPYYYTGNQLKLNIPIALQQDEILKISKDQQEFIPLQQTRFSSVDITLDRTVDRKGFYAILKGKDTVQQFALNIEPSESTHNHLDLALVAKSNINVEVLGSIEALFEEINEKNKDVELWKLFLVLAIVSLCFEILILKFFKT